ncbi:hypothetical protein BJ912DRAFT_920841 [Pholiota molesta]|nr:hypothetical protein BJ912DRAFT_920841 [Pholiota molesta]
MATRAARMEEKLPATVEAIKDGWQLTSQGGLAVSGLLAVVSAQLLTYFRDPATYDRRSTPQGARDAVLALNYCALLLNIGATISAFIILDRMGSLTLLFACKESQPTIGAFAGTEMQILRHYGAGPRWKFIIWHWLICFYGGITCLVFLLVTFIWLQEVSWIGIITSLISGFALVPSWLMMLV